MKDIEEEKRIREEKTRKKRNMINSLFPYLYTFVSIYEAALEFYQLPRVLLFLKPLISILLINYFYSQTFRNMNNYRSIILISLILTIMIDEFYCYYRDEKSVWTVFAVAYSVIRIIQIAGFGYSIYQESPYISISQIVLNSLPFMLFFGLIYSSMMINLGNHELIVQPYLIFSMCLGIFTLLRRKFTNKTSFWKCLCGSLNLILFDSLVVIIRFLKINLELALPGLAGAERMGNLLLVMGVLSHKYENQQDKIPNEMEKLLEESRNVNLLQRKKKKKD